MTLTGREREPCARPTMPPRSRVIAPPLPALQSPRPPPATETHARGSAIPLRPCWQHGHHAPGWAPHAGHRRRRPGRHMALPGHRRTGRPASDAQAASAQLPPPPLPVGSIRAQRRVHASGRVMVNRQPIKLGPGHACPRASIRSWHQGPMVEVISHAVNRQSGYDASITRWRAELDRPLWDLSKTALMGAEPLSLVRGWSA
jgi:hypothetical protein